MLTRNLFKWRIESGECRIFTPMNHQNLQIRTGYWLELLSESGKVDEKAAAPVLREANELVAISISSINTAKRNSGGEE